MFTSHLLAATNIADPDVVGLQPYDKGWADKAATSGLSLDPSRRLSMGKKDHVANLNVFQGAGACLHRPLKKVSRMTAFENLSGGRAEPETPWQGARGIVPLKVPRNRHPARVELTVQLQPLTKQHHSKRDSMKARALADGRSGLPSANRISAEALIPLCRAVLRITDWAV